MSFDRRLAIPLAAGLLLAWWAAARRSPAGWKLPNSRPERAAVPVAPAASRSGPDGAPALEAPAPVLERAASRRFSSPVSNGSAPGDAPGNETPAREAARLAGASVSLPGGYGAAASGSVPGAPAQGPASPPGGERSAAAAGAGAREDAARPGAADKRVTGAAAGLVAAARGLKTRGDTAAMRADSDVAAGIVKQIALENKIDARIRDGIAGLERSGRPVTPEAVARIAEGVLKENGIKPGEGDLESAVARASGPPPPAVPAAAYAEAAKAVASAPPLDPVQREEIERLAASPPPPRAPAPKGALDAFRQHQGVLGQAEKDFGVKPEHILGILGVETAWGRNTGKYPLPSTLKAISERVGADGNPTKPALQAGRDRVALTRLAAEGNLGGLKPEQVYGSYAGAMGIPQFLPTSWVEYSRAPDGGKRDPFDFGTAAYSVGNYLKVHGYGKDVSRSIWGYNHSQEYVNKVLGLSADVKASLSAAPPPPK